MGDIYIRIALVAALGVIVFAASRWVGSRSRVERRHIDAKGLAPGVYLFTSSECADCEVARANLVARLGRDGFTEMAWESSPDVFAVVDVEAVPSTLIVDFNGQALLYPGRPDVALASLGP